MQTLSPWRLMAPLISIFVVTCSVSIVFSARLSEWGIDPSVLLIGNIILFIATLISFVFYRRSLNNNHAPFFMRMIYSAMLAKMMICILAAFVYIVTYRKEASKGAIFACMFLYFVYTFVELSIVLKISKEKKNA